MCTRYEDAGRFTPATTLREKRKEQGVSHNCYYGRCMNAIKVSAGILRLSLFVWCACSAANDNYSFTESNDVFDIGKSFVCAVRNLRTLC